MPMSPRLLRPRASGPTHPEAKDWVSRVVANGGTVGSSTAAAVDKFCRDIDATSGLRAAILRLNLFCGNDLNACLVPLYRAASLAGSVIGNTTDTNSNFVSGDYESTGANGGLKGNGTTKALDTGFQIASIPSLLDMHMSFSGTSLETSGDRIALGCFNGLDSTLYCLDVYAGYVSGRAARFPRFASNSFPVVTSPGTSEQHFLGTRTANNLCTIYRAGTSAATNTFTVTPVSITRTIRVFCLNESGTSASFTSGRLRMYSIGNGITASQALAFSNAVNTLNTALGRA